MDMCKQTRAQLYTGERLCAMRAARASMIDFITNVTHDIINAAEAASTCTVKNTVPRVHVSLRSHCIISELGREYRKAC